MVIVGIEFPEATLDLDCMARNKCDVTIVGIEFLGLQKLFETCYLLLFVLCLYYFSVIWLGMNVCIILVLCFWLYS